MFIITAKFNKRKVIAALLILVAVVAIIVICLSSGGDSDSASPAVLTAVVKNNSQRVAFLESLGWEISDEPVEEQTITIPQDFSDVYAEYNELQLQQGFDLTKYSGLEAVRYTYEVTNYPVSEDAVVADIIVYRNQIIAGDIQCISADGFMTVLSYPGNT